MTRVKRGTLANKRRKNTLSQTKGYRFARSTKEAQAKEAIAHAGTMRTVTVQANGGMRVQGTLRTQALSNTASLRNPVCADTLGNLVKCSSF